MLNAILRLLIRALLWLRYRIQFTGLDELAGKDDRGILFLPNHPALIDPVILLTLLTRRFQVRALASREQVDKPGIRWLARRINVRTILDPRAQGAESKHQIAGMMRDVVRGLREGEALVLYPAGRIYRHKLEDLGGNSAVEFLIRAVPNVRIVLIRTRGLWGSSFGRASGRPPSVVEALRRGAMGLLKSGIVFAPRRKIQIEIREPDDFPRGEGRHAINRYLESFYNQGALPNTYVPYSIWEESGVRTRKEPREGSGREHCTRVPESTEGLVAAHLASISGVKEVRPEMKLAHDLGLDSLTRVELQAWIEREFGFPQAEGDVLETVEDVMLAASGEGSADSEVELKPVASQWFSSLGNGPSRYLIAPGVSIAEAFLQQALAKPKRVIVADQNSGTRSYRDLLTAVFVLRREFAKYPGEYVGIMLPASVAAVVTYLAILFSGKTPVLINWTTGPRAVVHCLEQLGVAKVVSARKLFQKLSGEGFGQATSLLERVQYLEDVASKTSLLTKLGAAFRARAFPRTLRHSPCPDTVAVLFTSGSESLPKSVPLTSANLLTNLRDVTNEIELIGGDALLGMLPPFHSFGLTLNLLLPLVSGLPVVYHSNPTESAKLAAHIETYQVSVMAGTPTFLAGILRTANEHQLDTLRLVVTGAEQCPPHVYDALAQRCPRAIVLEGYGITECSPVISANRPGRQQRGTIGELMPSLEAVLVDPDTQAKVTSGERGMLLVRGPSVFSGYLGRSGESPFVEFEGKLWYKTGDLVKARSDGMLEFVGRLKRFVKLGGEMISLPAVEAVLNSVWSSPDDERPRLAVEATPNQDHTELVLFATAKLEREVVNRQLRDAGLSPLHNIRRIVVLDEIPLLGTGKIDYRTLKEQLTTDQKR